MNGVLVGLRRRDEQVLGYLVARRRPWLDAAMRSLTRLGDAAVTIALAALLLLAPLPTWHHAGRAGAFALVASHLAVQLLKRTISRPRPRLGIGAASLIEAPDRFSFPSGHAASSLSVALAVSALVPPALMPCVLGLALLAGISRCYLGVHYPGDVVAGWLLALTAFSVWPAL